MEDRLFRVMVVDDEQLPRNGLIKEIDWEKYGCEVVADAENGEQAMEMLPQCQPDIIITDICMPFMDGLELIEAISGMDIDAIIMSAYDEFEYARMAVCLGAIAYLLKPVAEAELGVYLEKIVKQRRNRTRSSQETKLFQDMMNGSGQIRLSTLKALEDAKAYIDQNLGNSLLSLNDVAENIGISRNYFCTLFKKHQGISFAKYLINARMMKAMDLLANTDMMIYEVSEAVGFNDQTWFSTTFKKIAGKTPSDYRGERCEA